MRRLDVHRHVPNAISVARIAVSCALPLARREPVAAQYLAMAAAGAAAIEELCMDLFLPDPDPDRPGFFSARRRS